MINYTLFFKKLQQTLKLRYHILLMTGFLLASFSFGYLNSVLAKKNQYKHVMEGGLTLQKQIQQISKEISSFSTLSQEALLQKEESLSLLLKYDRNPESEPVKEFLALLKLNHLEVSQIRNKKIQASESFSGLNTMEIETEVYGEFFNLLEFLYALEKKFLVLIQDAHLESRESADHIRLSLVFNIFFSGE